jgi:DNA-binding TFAR19-related protein (PDSD5 family)
VGGVNLEEIKRRKLQEIQAQQEAQNRDQEQHDLAIESILRNLLDSEARSRLKNIELANPELAEQVISLIVQLYQGGRLSRVTDAQLLSLLKKISERRRETTIRRI